MLLQNLDGKLNSIWQCLLQCLFNRLSVADEWSQNFYLLNRL